MASLSRGLWLFLRSRIWFFQETIIQVFLHRYRNGLPFKVMRLKKSKTPSFTLPTRYRFGLFPVRSPLLGESYVYHQVADESAARWYTILLFSFPLATEMFHFTRFSPMHLWIQRMVSRLGRDGLPHSDISGSKVAYHLPEAYRRLLRPSSSDNVKASIVCSYTLQKHTIVLLFLFSILG